MKFRYTAWNVVLFWKRPLLLSVIRSIYLGFSWLSKYVFSLTKLIELHLFRNPDKPDKLGSESSELKSCTWSEFFSILAVRI